jgi:hypothetical protein
MSGSPAGTEVPVWVDRDGTVTTPPTNAADAWVNGALVGFDVLLLGGAVLVGIWMWVRRLTASVNTVEWEREWARSNPTGAGMCGDAADPPAAVVMLRPVLHSIGR